MADVIVIGGGLAGLSAAAALGGAGHSVRLFESRPFLGGRAASYESGSDTIDNCQHILLRCCVNLIDFYERLGVAGDIRWFSEYVFIEPGGRRSVMRAGWLPAPLHFTGSFASLKFLNFSEKLAVARGLLAIRRESARTDLDSITMQQWLAEHGQPPRAIERFWRQILVSAISEELDRIAAAHAFQVFRLAFLATSNAYEMGVPAVPLGQLYRPEAWSKLGHVAMRLRAPVDQINIREGMVHCIRAGGECHRADYYVCALPFERLAPLDVPVDVSGFTHAPITGIHLWFDRPVIDIPQATLLDRTIQWIFNKSEGRYVQLVVSASHSLVEMPRAEVIGLALRELAEFFPATREARVEKAHVVKEVRAVLSPRPGLESRRPASRTEVRNLFLAGDWTRTGWPAIMESAVRSGYLAAEAVTQAAGSPRQFLLPDLDSRSL
ncbi:MAG TPA: hydroxysqualene dehydroxylase HpnE [Bryobacteraceae bacterium]|nr:hydroxysqualene dehydroxylase HpnE [Bryobacteraceae bacterium]